VTELSVSLFYIALCSDLAGDSAWFHCVLWSFIHLVYKVKLTDIFSFFRFIYSVTFSLYILWKIGNSRMILIIYLGETVEDAAVFRNKIVRYIWLEGLRRPLKSCQMGTKNVSVIVDTCLLNILSVPMDSNHYL
jgi:hypothetical protein